MAVVEQPVADALRRARLPDDLMPLGDRNGAGHDDAALKVALLNDIEKDFPLLGFEDIRAKVVQDQELHLPQLFQGLGIGSQRSLRHHRIQKDAHSIVTYTIPVAAAQVAQRETQVAFPRPCRSADKDVVGLG